MDALAKNTGEARRALYERARSALVAQLRSVEPALSESDITKERLALEEAIRKVESEAARKALADPRPQPRVEPRAETRPAPRQPFAETRPRTAPDPEPRRDRINSTAADLPPAAQAGPASASKTDRARSCIPGSPLWYRTCQSGSDLSAFPYSRAP